LRLGFILITLLLACFALSQRAQGVVPPPPGGYPNFTTAAGDNALRALTSGVGNTAIGNFSLFSVTTGGFNTAVGAGALDLNTADNNTATGAAALLFNITGIENTANGTAALESNDSGSNNTAIGAFALFSNTGGVADFGSFNIAVGDRALFSNTTGIENTANGYQALVSNTTGNDNTATGAEALASNTTGDDNTVTGSFALSLNTTGSFNTAIGEGALGSNTEGINNTAVGGNAGFSLTGNNNIVIGFNVFGLTGESNIIRIGNTGITDTYIGGISGQTATGGAAVFVNSDGKLGTATSSARFKDQIKPMDKASEAILALKPVTFRYKKEIDSKGVPQFGLVAEEVAEVNADLVVRDEKGEIYTVRYEAVNAMLLNEFLKEHKKVEKQEATITRLTNDFQTVSTQQRNEIQLLSAQLKEQAAQIQKVSAKLEASKPAPQVVNNP
jgi:Chaperone of endosialidase